MAVVWTQVRRSPVNTATARLAALLTGSALIAAGVAALLWTRLGPGPLDVLITSISSRWSIPITFVVWGIATFMMAAAWLLGRRPGLGTLALPLVSGALLPVFIGLFDRWSPPGGITVTGMGVHVVAIAIVGLGAGLVIVAGLGAGMGELLAAAASDRTGRPEPLVRTSIELSWLVMGLLLGGVAGLGTVLVTLTIGPAVRAGYQVVTALLGEGAPTADTDHRVRSREIPSVSAHSGRNAGVR